MGKDEQMRMLVVSGVILAPILAISCLSDRKYAVTVESAVDVDNVEVWYAKERIGVGILGPSYAKTQLGFRLPLAESAETRWTDSEGDLHSKLVKVRSQATPEFLNNPGLLVFRINQDDTVSVLFEVDKW